MATSIDEQLKEFPEMLECNKCESLFPKKEIKAFRICSAIYLGDKKISLETICPICKEHIRISI